MIFHWKRYYAKDLNIDKVKELSVESKESSLILWLNAILYLIDNSTKVSSTFSKDTKETIIKIQSKEG